MGTRSQVRFVMHRPNHHSPHSGYDRLTDYGADYYDSSKLIAKPFTRKILRNRILYRIANGVIAYNRESFATEIKTALHLLNSSKTIFHILYGEITYHYLGFLNNFRLNRLIASFHQPPERFKRIVQIQWHLRQLSAIICVGRNQKDFFSTIVDPGRVFFVPHGIDTDFFTPMDSFDDRDPNLCLFVGQHLRDFPTLRGVIELVAFQRPETQFVAVTSPKGADLIGQHPNLTIKSGIPESELLELYRSACILLMPVQDATANNVLLEGMACGLPIVTSDIGSTRDYVNPECAILVDPFNSISMAEEVLKLLNNPSQLREFSSAARNNSLAFSWRKITKQLQSIYETVA